MSTQAPEWAKTIRDPVQKDVSLTKAEVEIIDTKTFQRLRRIRQLGTVHLLYPGAVHTRFEHSLGTLAVAQRMLVAINSNPDSQRLDDNQASLTRLAALLHDLPHVPFGHTLEDEARLFERHDSPERVERWLGDDSEIGSLIQRRFDEDMRDRLVKVLQAKGDDQLRALGRDAAVADIVGNTICADLLDYLARDLLFTGLEGGAGTRLLNYLYVPDQGDHANRLVLRTHKLTSQRMRPDVVTEALDLRRLRFRLAQSVYYHHSKMCTSAMIGAAVGYSEFANDSMKLGDFGDDQLLYCLREKDGPAGDIAGCLLDRRLYKPAYTVEYSQFTMGDPKDARVKDLIRTYNQAPDASRARQSFQEELCKLLHLPEGSVILYCPDSKMQLKPAEARIAWHSEYISKLEEADDESVKKEVDLLKQRHRSLWKLTVFIHPDHAERWQNVGYECEKRFGLASELAGIKPGEPDRWFRHVHSWAVRKPEFRLLATEEDQLTAQIEREEVTSCTDDELAKQLAQLRAGNALVAFRESEDGRLKHPKLELSLLDQEVLTGLSGGSQIDVTSLLGLRQITLLLHLRDVVGQWNGARDKQIKEKAAFETQLRRCIFEQTDHVFELARHRRPNGSGRDRTPKQSSDGSLPETDITESMEIMEKVFLKLIDESRLLP